MICVICNNGTTGPGRVTVTLERGSATIVIKSVPAEVCDNCGEHYLSEETTRRLSADVDRSVDAGTTVEIRTYKAA